MKKKKIGFVASSGGHFEQLMMLKPLTKKYDSFILTEKTKYSPKIDNTRIYFVKQINRKERNTFFKLISIFFVSLNVFFKEKPDVIITTGVLATIPICLIAKLFRKKVIYIESFAKITSPTKTGKFIYRFADQFYVQWETMLKYYPNAIYIGGIY